jgi:hypothetical protein
LQLAGGASASSLSAGCALDRRWTAGLRATVGTPLSSQADGAARLRARPRGVHRAEAGTPGLHPLGLAGTRDALLYVPSSYPTTPAPLVLSLHGAGGDAQGGLYPLQTLADDGGFLLLSVPSRGRTWDGCWAPSVRMWRFSIRRSTGLLRATPSIPSTSRWPGFRTGRRMRCRLASAMATCLTGSWRSRLVSSPRPRRVNRTVGGGYG